MEPLPPKTRQRYEIVVWRVFPVPQDGGTGRGGHPENRRTKKSCGDFRLSIVGTKIYVLEERVIVEG